MQSGLSRFVLGVNFGTLKEAFVSIKRRLVPLETKNLTISMWFLEDGKCKTGVPSLSTQLTSAPSEISSSTLKRLKKRF